MRPEDLAELRRLTLFQSLSDESLQKLTFGALLQRFPAGTVLFNQGERPDFLHVLLSGSVQLYAESSKGREAVVEVIHPVECFILAAALTDAPNLMSARVLEDSRVLLLSAEVFRKQLTEDGQLGLTMLASLAGQFRVMVRQVKNLKLRTATQRLGCYILSLNAKKKTRDQLELPYRKAVLASQLGVTPEALSRAFQTLAQHGVEVHGQYVTLHDAEALSAYCSPDTLIDEADEDLTVRP